MAKIEADLAAKREAATKELEAEKLLLRAQLESDKARYLAATETEQKTALDRLTQQHAMDVESSKRAHTAALLQLRRDHEATQAAALHQLEVRALSSRCGLHHTGETCALLKGGIGEQEEAAAEQAGVEKRIEAARVELKSQEQAATNTLNELRQRAASEVG